MDLERIFFWFHIWPQMKKELEKIKWVLPDPIQPRPPFPDPPPMLWQEIAPILVDAVFGEPNPEPNRLVEAKMEVLKGTVAALDGLTQSFKEQLDHLSAVGNKA